MAWSGLNFWDFFIGLALLAAVVYLVGGLRMGELWEKRQEARRIQTYTEKRMRITEEDGRVVVRRLRPVMRPSEDKKKK